MWMPNHLSLPDYLYVLKKWANVIEMHEMMALLNSAVELDHQLQRKTAIKWQNYIIVGQRWWVDASCYSKSRRFHGTASFNLMKIHASVIDHHQLSLSLSIYHYWDSTRRKEYIWELLMQSQIKLKKEILDKDILKWTHDVHKK